MDLRMFKLLVPSRQIELNDLSMYALVYECEYMDPIDLDAITYLGVGSSCTFNGGTDKEWKVIRTD